MTPEEEAVLRQQLAAAQAAQVQADQALQVQAAAHAQQLAEKEAQVLRVENARLQAVADRLHAERSAAPAALPFNSPVSAKDEFREVCELTAEAEDPEALRLWQKFERQILNFIGDLTENNVSKLEQVYRAKHGSVAPG